MVTRQRVIVKTPRKDKSWAYTRGQGQVLSVNAVQVAVDLLTDYETDVGLINRNVTAMRIVGELDLGNGSSASVATSFTMQWGIAWVSGAIAVLAANDASIPDPGELGAREAQWLQRGSLQAQSLAGANTAGATQGQLRASVILDITQMRKQPTPDSRLVLITRNNGSASHAPAIYFALATMLALP